MYNANSYGKIVYDVCTITSTNLLGYDSAWIYAARSLRFDVDQRCVLRRNPLSSIGIETSPSLVMHSRGGSTQSRSTRSTCPADLIPGRLLAVERIWKISIVDSTFGTSTRRVNEK
jgi:hypothetical protein